MLRKIIAIAMGFVLLANPSMIVSAGTESKETTVAATTVVTQEYPESVETTVVSSEALDETTTNTAEATSPEDVGAAIREGLDVKVGDIVYFDDMLELKDKDGNVLVANMGSRLYIIGVNDKKQSFRVYASKVTPKSGAVVYLTYEDSKEGEIVSHEGLILGDVDLNGSIDARDFTLLKRWILTDWEDEGKFDRLLSDMNSDEKVDVKDVEIMQQWLLGSK